MPSNLSFSEWMKEQKKPTVKVSFTLDLTEDQWDRIKLNLGTDLVNAVHLRLIRDGADEIYSYDYDHPKI